MSAYVKYKNVKKPGSFNPIKFNANANVTLELEMNYKWFKNPSAANIVCKKIHTIELTPYPRSDYSY